MSKKFANFLIFISFFVLAAAFFGAIQSNAAPATPSASNGATATTEDQLLAAGFTGVKALAPTSTRFKAPARYFRVKESVDATAGWGDSSSIVSVLVMQKYSPDWSYNDGKIEIRDIGGRTQARATSAKNYIVVTGPDQQKVAILAHDLQLAP